MVIECFGEHNSSEVQFLDEVLLGKYCTTELKKKTFSKTMLVIIYLSFAELDYLDAEVLTNNDRY
jgi:hypothetical protein